MIGRVKDVHAFRGVAAGMSDHFLVEAKVVVANEWGNRVGEFRREMVKMEELKKPEKRQEYQDRLKVEYDRVGGQVAAHMPPGTRDDLCTRNSHFIPPLDAVFPLEGPYHSKAPRIRLDQVRLGQKRMGRGTDFYGD
ncbi:hypothetical protein SK128_024051 [Halocaridina rubra]|uniref:Uncharacterized protein n=1 Tax=Halocaridina rubra TaxID=373956 RepID=A0AAN9A1B8_HALRR